MKQSKPSIDLLSENLTKRAEVSKVEYGTYLEPFSGRHALTDLYQELLDAIMYRAQSLMERTGVYETQPSPNYAFQSEPPPLPSIGSTPVIDFVKEVVQQEEATDYILGTLINTAIIVQCQIEDQIEDQRRRDDNE